MAKKHRRSATALIAAVALGAPAFAQTPAAGAEQSTAASSQRATSTTRTARAGAAAPNVTVVRAAPELKPCTAVTVDPPTHLTLGKSRVIRLDFPAARIVVGGHSAARAGAPEPAPQPGTPGAAPGAAPRAAPVGATSDGVADTQITLLSPTELFFLGRKTGSMNVVLQGTDGRCVVKDIIVTVDPETLQAKLGELMPEQTGVRVRGAESSLVLIGTVSDLVKLDQIMILANSYGDPKHIVNLLRVSAPQQVMLEVKIAEVSKTLLDRFGLDFSRLVTSADGMKSSIISGIIGGGAGVLGRFHPNIPGSGAINGSAVGAVSGQSGAANASFGTSGTGGTLLGIDAQKQDGVIRVLAEPNIMAISGQSASFLSGGKIFIPVAQDRSNGGTTITLEEKEFGVGLKFTPTVLDGRINLKITSEVSELSQTGTPFTSVGGVTAILPSMSTRRVDTTVQLGDGQSFAVAGLIKNNFTESLNKFPGLGEVPVMGALFRSTEFQNDQTELMFVVTPRLVKPLNSAAVLPTDNHVMPTRSDIILMGSGEGKRPPARTSDAQGAPVAPAAPAPAPAMTAGTPPAAPSSGKASSEPNAPAAPMVEANPAAPTASREKPPVQDRPTDEATTAPVRTSAIEAEPVPLSAPATTRP
jgi:pilus assembly protein CpaC